MDPPHVAEDPQTVSAVVRRFVHEVWLIASDPPVGIGLAKVPVHLCQFADEVCCLKALIPFRVELNARHKGGANFVWRGILAPQLLFLYTVTLMQREINAGMPINAGR